MGWLRHKDIQYSSLRSAAREWCVRVSVNVWVGVNMSVCMYRYVHALCMLLNVYVSMSLFHVCIWVCMHVWGSMFMCLCASIRMYGWVYVCEQNSLCMYVHMCTHMGMWVCSCMYVFVCMNTCVWMYVCGERVWVCMSTLSVQDCLEFFWVPYLLEAQKWKKSFALEAWPKVNGKYCFFWSTRYNSHFCFGLCCLGRVCIVLVSGRPIHSCSREGPL